MTLSDTKLRNLTTPGKHFDGGSLYLEVTPAGGRYGRLKYKHVGEEKRFAFGVYPEVTLKQARERRDEASEVIERGEDPGDLRKAAKVPAEHESVSSSRTTTPLHSRFAGSPRPIRSLRSCIDFAHVSAEQNTSQSLTSAR